MRIGLAGGPLPADPDALDSRVAARVAALGFDGVVLHLGARGAPGALDAGRCRRARATLDRHGLPVVQSWSFGANLVASGEDERLRQLEVVDGAMRVARDLGAEAVIGGAGSRAAAGGYSPHPDNHGDAAETALVDSLQRVAGAAERRRCAFVLEPHVATTPDTPERIRAILDRVGSEWVRVNLDPANLVGSLADLYGSTALLERMFASLRGHAASGHVKDVAVRDDFVLHLDEALPGDGRLDLSTYFRLFERHLGERFMVVEHVPPEDVPEAKRRVDAILAGVTGGREQS